MYTKQKQTKIKKTNNNEKQQKISKIDCIDQFVRDIDANDTRIVDFEKCVSFYYISRDTYYTYNRKKNQPRMEKGQEKVHLIIL